MYYTHKSLVINVCSVYYDPISNYFEDIVKSSELIKKLEANGWVLVRVNGSHHQFKHPDNPLIATVPHPRKDIKPGTLRQILKDAGLK